MASASSVMLRTSPTTRKVCVFTNWSISSRLSAVRSSSSTSVAMCFTSVSSANPKAINWMSGGKNMKNSVSGSRNTTRNSL